MNATNVAGNAGTLNFGTNHDKATHRVHGRQFKLMATFPNTDDGCEEANAFMERNPGASVLANTDAVYIAHKDDMGEPAAQTK